MKIHTPLKKRGYFLAKHVNHAQTGHPSQHGLGLLALDRWLHGFYAQQGHRAKGG
jgi:hypothetical protein